MDLLKGEGKFFLLLRNPVVTPFPAVRSGPYGHVWSWLRRHLDRPVGGGGSHVDIWSQELLQGDPYPEDLFDITIALLGNKNERSI